MTKLRRMAAELVESAAEAGMKDPGCLLSLTPREIELEFRSFASRRRLRAEEADLEAYLAGRYFLIAMHAPRRYPRRPDGVRRAPQRMTDAQMKQIFAAMAAGREEGNGDC